LDKEEKEDADEEEGEDCERAHEWKLVVKAYEDKITTNCKGH
jgi:hypothetical protein